MSDETKTCSVCAESIKAAAIECRFCNNDLAAYSVAKEAETEKTLFTWPSSGHLQRLAMGGCHLLVRRRLHLLLDAKHLYNLPDNNKTSQN